MHRSNTFSTATLDVPNLIGQSPLRDGFPVILFVLAVIFPLSLGLIPAARAQLFSVAVLSGPNGGALQDLGTLGGSFSFATGVNNRGQVSGYSSLPGDNTTQHAFLSAPNGGPLHDLGTLYGGDSIGTDVNSSGQVTGGASFPDVSIPGGAFHAFLSEQNSGPLHDLGTLGGPSSNGNAVNDSGQVAGTSEVPEGGIASRAFLSDPHGGTLHDLGTLGGIASFATDVNNRGQVTGASFTADQSVLPSLFEWYYWWPLQNLGTLGEGTFSVAEGINNRGEVVGISSLSGTAGEHAFIYTAANGMQDLNSLIAPASGLILVQAWDINDSGQITGLAFSGNQGRAFLLTPIAPSSYTVTIIPRIQVGNAVNDRGQVAGTLGVPELGTTLSFLAPGLTPIMLCAKLSVQRAGRAR